MGRVRINFRYYNPADGRWTRRDPAGIEGGLNLYGYASNFAITQVDILGLLVMMECTRYGDEYGSMRCSISIYNDLCRCNECQKYADSVYTARNNNALLENIALLKSCAKIQKPDKECKSFPTNTKKNTGRGGIPANQYYRLYPKPNGGKQDSKGKFVDNPTYSDETGAYEGTDFHKGTPSPTSLEYGPSQAGKVKDARVGGRNAIRIHPEGESHGCITVTGTCMGKPLTSVVAGEGLIEQLMMQHKKCGGMYLHIVEG